MAAASAMERLARRLDIVAPRTGWELYIFGTEGAARHAGFGGSGRRHREMPAVYWTVGMDPQALRGMGLCRVIVTDYAARYAREQGSRATDRFLEALEIARYMLRHEPAVWMEL